MGAVFSNFDRAHDAQKHKSHNSISTLASSGWRHGNARIFSITRRTPTNVTWASCSFIWSTKIQRLWVFDVYSQRYQCCRVTTTEDSSVPPLALLPHYCYRHASHDFRHTFVAPMNLMRVMQFYLEHKKIQTFVGVRRVFAKIRALPCHHHRRQCLSRSSTLLLRAPHPITFVIRSSHL